MPDFIRPSGSAWLAFRVQQESHMATKKTSNETSGNTAPDWQLRLYVAGQTARSAQAIQNLRTICEQHLEGRYAIEVIDLKLNPALAADHQILAVPTLIRKVPESIRMSSPTRCPSALGRTALRIHRRSSAARYPSPTAADRHDRRSASQDAQSRTRSRVSSPFREADRPG